MAFRLLFDAMMPRVLGEALAREGYDIVYAVDLDRTIQENDELLLEYARSRGRVLFTCNYSDSEHNFIQIDKEWRESGREHAGVLLCPQKRVSSRIWEVRDSLRELLDSRTSDDMWNILIWL